MEKDEKRDLLKTHVTVKAMSEARRILGWGEKEVDFEGSTLGDLLQVLTTPEGDSLYQRMVDGGNLKGDYVFTVNGRIITSLASPLHTGDRVMAMDVVRLFHGG